VLNQIEGSFAILGQTGGGRLKTKKEIVD